LVAGKLGKSIIAPFQYDGSMDCVLFEHWFESYFLPSIPSSSTAVLDNASFHRKSKLYLLAQKYGHKLIFLPPYCPELNKIENFWSWLKGMLKKFVSRYDDFNDALSYCFNVI